MSKQILLTISILYTLFVFYICLAPLEVAEEMLFPYFDKIVHLGLYFILSLCWYITLLTYNESRFKLYLITALLCFCVGVVIEMLQYKYFGRTADRIDVLFNSIGILLSSIAVLLLKRNRRYIKEVIKGI